MTLTLKKKQKQLGLTDWEIAWNFGDRNTATVMNDSDATSYINYGNKNVFIELHPAESTWKKSIRHELLELVLFEIRRKLTNNAKTKVEKEEIDSMVQSVIRRLEDLV